MGLIIQDGLIWKRATTVATAAGSSTVVIGGAIVHRDGKSFNIGSSENPLGFTRQTNGRYRPTVSGWNYIGADPSDAGYNRPDLTVTIRDNSGTRWRNSITLPNGGAMALYLYSDWEIELSTTSPRSGIWKGVAGPVPDMPSSLTPFAWRPTAVGQSRSMPSVQWLVRQSNDKTTTLRAISPGTQSRSVTFPGSGGGTALLDCRWPGGEGTVNFQAGATGEDMYFTPVHIF